MYWISNRRQPTRGGSADLGSGEELTTVRRKNKTACCTGLRTWILWNDIGNGKWSLFLSRNSPTLKLHLASSFRCLVSNLHQKLLTNKWCQPSSLLQCRLVDLHIDIYRCTFVQFLTFESDTSFVRLLLKSDVHVYRMKIICNRRCPQEYRDNVEFSCSYLCLDNRCSSVSIVTRLLTGRLGFNSRQELGFFFFTSLPRPNRLWGPPSLLPNGYRRLLPPGKAGGAWSWPLNLICCCD
jgi:hypothetical protein